MSQGSESEKSLLRQVCANSDYVQQFLILCCVQVYANGLFVYNTHRKYFQTST